jgi:hypothetical protein
MKKPALSSPFGLRIARDFSCTGVAAPTVPCFLGQGARAAADGAWPGIPLKLLTVDCQ